MSFNELSGRIGRARWLRLGWFKPESTPGNLAMTLTAASRTAITGTHSQRTAATLTASQRTAATLTQAPRTTITPSKTRRLHLEATRND